MVVVVVFFFPLSICICTELLERMERTGCGADREDAVQTSLPAVCISFPWEGSCAHCKCWELRQGTQTC